MATGWRAAAARWSAEDGATRLFIHGDEWWDDAGDYLQYRAFLRQADRDLVFRASGRPDVRARVGMGLFTHASRGKREVEVVIPKTEYAKIAKGVPYAIHPANAVSGYRWKVKDGLTLTRSVSVEDRLEHMLERLEKLERRLDALERK